MEVPGKRVTTKDKINIECEPCAEEDNLRAANGLCLECDQFMCTECFQHHRKGKLCKNHELGDLTGRRLEQRSRHKEEDDGKTCEEHLGETVKFYCPEHVQVGCGDCMVLEHKTCEVQYIRKKAATLKETLEFRSFNTVVDQYLKEVAQQNVDIKESKMKTEEWSAKFRKDIETFRDKLISHINKLANGLLFEGEKALSEAKQETLVLETECEKLSKDVTILKESNDVNVAHPQKQFISTIQSMPKLKTIEGQLSKLKERRNQKYYEFLCNPKLQAVIECKSLGTIRELTEDKEDETDGKKQAIIETIKQSQQINLFKKMKPQSQLLMERQLKTEHILVDGDFLTYVDDEKEVPGIFVDSHIMKNGRYFEVEILCWGVRGSISVGVVPLGYPRYQCAGWMKDSVAYHGDDGKLFFEKGHGEPFGPVCKPGDKMGCGYFTISSRPAVYFTHNGEKIGHALLSHEMIEKKLYPAVGLFSLGEKVKVCLDAKAPIQDI